MSTFYPQISPRLTSSPKWHLVSWGEGRRGTIGGTGEVALAGVTHDPAQSLPSPHLTPVPLHFRLHREPPPTLVSWA